MAPDDFVAGDYTRAGSGKPKPSNTAPKPRLTQRVSSNLSIASDRARVRAMPKTTGSRDSRQAAAPAATGAAIEVPLIGPKPCPGSVDSTPTPGAVTAICGPTLENAALNSSGSDPRGDSMTSACSSAPVGKVPTRPSALTAGAPAYAAGYDTALRSSLPAATMTSIPWFRASLIASSTISSNGP